MTFGNRILLAFGTRPEAIKLAPVVKVLRQAGTFEVRVCMTAQHRRMLDQVLALFAITPDVDLDLMQPGQDLTDLTARVLVGMRGVLRDWRPDLLLVQGVAGGQGAWTPRRRPGTVWRR
jgi:UDP-N-acetylglucosamine 2-epimerase (non-hydrolysing)